MPRPRPRPHEYTLVETADRLREVIAAVGRYEEFCFDTETTGLDVFNDRIVGLSLAVEPFRAWYIPFNEANTREYVEIIRPLFENEHIAKIGQNVKFDLMVLRQLGITIRGRFYDTMILHYLLDPESRTQHERAGRALSELPPDRDRDADRQGLQTVDDGSGQRRAGEGVCGRGCRRDAAAEAGALPHGRTDRHARPLLRDRGADDCRAGRHRDGGRSDRHRGAGALCRGAEPQAGGAGGGRTGRGPASRI